MWADGESRILHPGDVASVPAGVLHAYQFHGHYSQFMGPIAPAGWDRFFDFTGSPYAGPAYPQVDDSPPPFAKFGAAEAKFAMKYFPDEPYAEASTGPDDALPGAAKPYFLRAGEGPRHVLFGQVAYQLMTGAESGGRLGMTVTEGPRGPAIPIHVHARSYEAIYCLDGRLRVTVDGEEHLLTARRLRQHPGGRRARVRDGCAPDAVRQHVWPGRASSASTRWRARSPSSGSSPSSRRPVDRDRLSARRGRARHRASPAEASSDGAAQGPDRRRRDRRPDARARPATRGHRRARCSSGSRATGRRSGYRLTLDADGGNALEACLPAELYERYLAHRTGLRADPTSRS